MALAMLLLAAAPAVFGGCPAFSQPQIHQLEVLVDRNPNQVLSQIDSRLRSLQGGARAGAAQRAALYAVQADAYGMLELDARAREAASKGLSLLLTPTDPVHVNLVIGYWQNIYDEAGLDQAVGQLSAARALQAPGSAADLCLQIALGVVQMRRDHPEIAISDLTQAYRATEGATHAHERILAASALSSVLRHVGDYAQSLAVNQQTIDYYAAHGDTLALSVARYLQAQTLGAMGNYEAAIEQLAQARELSIGIDDRQGVAFADQALCQYRIELGQATEARPGCEHALRVFAAAKSNDEVQQTQALLAHIDLAQGHAEQALARLNGVLANGGSELPARELPPIYDLRSRTNAALQDYPHAYQDLREYLKRYQAVNDADRNRQTAALRAQLETDREIERNGTLQRELLLSQERSDSQSKQLHSAWLAGGAGVVVIALLTYILMSNLRYRRLLLRLATSDGLTALPNRRRTAELANAALARAATTGAPLTIALVDFDHFKLINDRCGHAAGDHALKQFARLSARVLRAGDTLGRWGGEEFLLVLPDCPLDHAYAIVQRLRALAVEIQLPHNTSNLRVSVSAGIAARLGDGMSLDELIASADAALYEAKAAGRDLVRIARDSLLAASTGIRRALTLEPSAAAGAASSALAP